MRSRNRQAGKSILLAGSEGAMATTLSILDVSELFFGEVEQQITFLQQKGLLATNKTCHVCYGSWHSAKKETLPMDPSLDAVPAKPQSH